jgi:ATP-dependent Clp protease ATP-binding subunit ClpA
MSWFQHIRKGITDSFSNMDASLNNLTPRAQQVLVLARKEATRFNHSFVGTEHILLGIVALGQGTAVKVLHHFGITLEPLRAEIEKQVGTGPDPVVLGNIPYTPRVKAVLAIASKEASDLHHTYIGTEHLLLGLLCEGDGVAARVLANLGLDVERTRQAILSELNPNFEPSTDATSSAKTSKPLKVVYPEGLDTSKRYDVYCSERNQEVIYRGVLFRSVKKLFQHNQYDTASQFIELEHQNGQRIFISRSSIIKFSEHIVKSDEGPSK